MEKVIPGWSRLAITGLNLLCSADLPISQMVSFVEHVVPCAVKGSYNANGIDNMCWTCKEDVSSAFSCDCIPKGLHYDF